jgi:hypothetical protein
MDGARGSLLNGGSGLGLVDWSYTVGDYWRRILMADLRNIHLTEIRQCLLALANRKTSRRSPAPKTASSESVRDKTQQMVAENQNGDIRKNPILELETKAKRRNKQEKIKAEHET